MGAGPRVPFEGRMGRRTEVVYERPAYEPPQRDILRVGMLGGFRVAVGDREVPPDAWKLKKAAVVVKLLALEPGHTLHREQVMEALWPNLGRSAASNNLRGALYAARRVLDPRQEETPQYLGSLGGRISLCPDGDLLVDVEAFEHAARTTRRSTEPGTYEAAIGLYEGELLPEDRYEQWAEERRGELQKTYISLLIGLASAHESRGDHGSAIEALREATVEEPANEEAHVGLMRLYALSGHQADALGHYELLCGDLMRELGTGPGASARALREEISSGRFPAEASWSYEPPSREEPPRHNLPSPRTGFVGRGREVVEVKRALYTTRLLTLTGAGGSGKTRLALKVATDCTYDYPGGVWLVELAGLSEPELVPQAVAGALGVREQPGRPLAETVADRLREQRALIVLDNCEHLLEEVASLLDFLLTACPHLEALATSREPLGVEGEVLFPVPPLTVPAGLPYDPGELGGFDSVRLFVDRTRLRLPGFSITRHNGPAVAEVCRKLDGIPLAIELAAARMGTLATEQVARRLEDSLGLLSAGPRTASPRHRTMRATIRWSYTLLSEGEKEVFGRLSAFSGGFALEAAEAVCQGGSIQESEILDLISGLVNKSLVVAEADAEGRVRYRLLEPVRQYAKEKLEESQEATAARRRHAAFFLALAERAEPELKGPGQVEWLKRLEEDNDNLRAAMAWLSETGEFETAVRLAFALWIFWMIHGHQGEGRRWIESVLARGENLPIRARAKALWVQASTYYGLGAPERLERICEEAAGLFRRLGDKRGLAYILATEATVAMRLNDPDRAIELFEEAFELSDDKWGTSGGLAHLGSIYLGQENYEEAARCFEEGLALSREIGNKLAASTALYGLAMAAQGKGDHQRAKDLYANGLESATEAGDRANIAYCLDGLAQVAAAQGQAERAVRLFGAAEASLEAAGGALYAYVQDRSLHDQALDATRSRLDESAFSAALADGATMSPVEAVEYALSEEAHARLASTASPRRSSIIVSRTVALTRREEEVATLVAQGLTNRQIASEISISEHTVANHIARVLRKLELGSRSQITAWVVQRRTLRYSGLRKE